MERSGRPKIEEKEGHVLEPICLKNKSGNVRKMTSKRFPNACLYFGGERPGALLGHLWRPSPFLNTTNEPKVPPKCPQELQITPKVTPKTPKSAKNDFKSAPESRNGPKVNSCGSFLFRKSATTEKFNKMTR